MTTAGRFSPDGTRFAVSCGTQVKLFDLQTENELVSLDGHMLAINDIAWSPCSRYIASAGDDFLVLVWCAKTFKVLKVLRGHTQSVTSVKFNYKGNLIVSTSVDENLRVWDVRQARCLTIMAAHSEPVCAADFSFDSTLIVSGSYDGLVRLWDTQSGHCLKTLASQSNPLPVTFTQFTPNAQYVIVVTTEGHIQVWDYVSVKIVMLFTAKPDKHTRSVALYKNLLYLGTATGADVFDIASGKQVDTIAFDGGALTVDVHDDLLLLAGPNGHKVLPANGTRYDQRCSP